MMLDDGISALSSGAEVGWLMLSIAIAFGTIWLAWRISRRSRWVTRALVGLGVYYMVFAWFPPQALSIIFLQIVDEGTWPQMIKWPPDNMSVIRNITFMGNVSFASLGSGIVGWLCVLVPLAFGRFEPPVRHH